MNDFLRELTDPDVVLVHLACALLIAAMLAPGLLIWKDVVTPPDDAMELEVLVPLLDAARSCQIRHGM